MSSTDETSDSNELERAAGQIEALLASLVGDYEESQSDSPTDQSMHHVNHDGCY